MIHFSGSFAPDDLVVRQVDSSWHAPPEVVELIEREWAAALAKPGRLLFDGELTRLESWRIEELTPSPCTQGEGRGGGSSSSSRVRLHLDLSRTTYKTFLGTNLTHTELADQYGSKILANPIGVSAALQSTDGFLLLGRRNSRVAYYPNRIHPFAGSVAEPDVFAAMRRELAEELHFTDRDITEIRCIGMAEDKHLRQPELIFHVQSSLSRREIEERVDATEHSGIVAIGADQRSIEPLLPAPELTPIGAASLRLWIRSSK